MISFKKFILEAADGKKPSFKNMDIESAVNFLNANCKNSLWMLKKDRPIFRGDGSVPRGDFLVVNSLDTTRKSQNTANHYTVILDNTPSMKDFPKRSKSFIATTTKATALSYSKKVWIVIPTDSCRIGVTKSYDIWVSPVKFPTFSAEIDIVNKLYKDVGLVANYEKMKAFGEKLKQSDKYDDILYSSMGKIARGKISDLDFDALKNDFIGTLDRAYSPSNTGLKHYTPASIPRNLEDRELWIEGEVVFISEEMWENLLDAYGK